MPRSTDPSAKYHVRKPLEAEATRSVSDRTLVATENAIAARAAASQRTASKAPPRSELRPAIPGASLRICIGHIDIAINVNRNRDAHQRQARRVRNQRRH